MRSIGDSPPFKEEYGAEFYSKPFPLCNHLVFESDEYWKCYVKSMTTTDHHPVGTCKMGPKEDPMAVVDFKTLSLHGMHNLRVVDGSIIPEIPSGNINIPIVMIAEKAADVIKSTIEP